MRALVLTDNPSEKLEIRTLDQPAVQPDEVLIRVLAAGLNHRDQWCREGKYPGIQTGVILGSDGVGIVVETGSEAGKEWIGKKVIINPNQHWGENPKVQSPDYTILGMPENGTFAEYVKVKFDRIHKCPSRLTDEEAASLPLSGLTAFRALFTHGNLQPGQHVLVSGIGGGVAQFLFLFAKAHGAKVTVTSGSEEKLNKALEMGADKVINYQSDQWPSDLSIDLVVDSAGGSGINRMIKSMVPGGKIIIYGATAGLPENLDLYRLFWNQISIHGSSMGNDEEFSKMLAFVEKHKIKPIIDSVRPLGQAIEAFDRMKSGIQFGKLVLKINE